jgi:hypothetical protein
LEAAKFELLMAGVGVQMLAVATEFEIAEAVVGSVAAAVEVVEDPAEHWVEVLVTIAPRAGS